VIQLEPMILPSEALMIREIVLEAKVNLWMDGAFERVIETLNNNLPELSTVTHGANLVALMETWGGCAREEFISALGGADEESVLGDLLDADLLDPDAYLDWMEENGLD
jgi:hypothetical protein